MSNNPSPAFKYTKCDLCDETMEEGDDVFFHNGDRYCEQCASGEDIICVCGQCKKPDFDLCYECYKETQDG